MQAPPRESTTKERIRPEIRVALPESLRTRAQEALGHLFDLSSSLVALDNQPNVERIRDRDVVQVFSDPVGWRIEGENRSERALTDEALLLRVQELLLESAVRARNQILFRGSVVTRGSQSVLIVGDLGSFDAVLAVALTALEFQLVSVGRAAFDARRPTPLPLPLLFRLDAADRSLLRSLPCCPEEPLEPLSPDLFRPRAVTSARELTHVLFPEARHGGLSLVRPISATTARTRLCSALAVGPDDPPPFMALAEVMRHARGVHLTLGELPRAVEQLARLLPRWCVA